MIGIGLDIEFVHEHPFTTYQQFEPMEKGEDGWRVPNLAHEIPLLFSMKARKPE